jgi:hypothetical protein
MNQPSDTVEREDTEDGGHIFTFRIVISRDELVAIRWLYLSIRDRLNDLIVDAESELILEEEKRAYEPTE